MAAMISKDSIETPYAFVHQKHRIYVHSTLDWQRDDIEMAIADFSESMNPLLYATLAQGRQDFLRRHSHFEEDLSHALQQLEGML